MALRLGDASVRPLTKEDLARIQQLVVQCGPYVTVRTPSDYWLFTELFANTCLGAYLGEQLVGVAIALVGQSVPKVAYVQDLAVLPACQRRGVGTLLMKHVIGALQEFGVGEVWLTTKPQNNAAILLWRRLGFENQPADYKYGEIWVAKNVKGPGEDRAIFRLGLA